MSCAAETHSPSSATSAATSAPTVAWCCLGITSTWVGACGLMSRKASTRSVSWTTSAGISPATMRQNRQSVTVATLEPRSARGTGLDAQIGLHDPLVGKQARGRSGVHDRAALQHVAVVGGAQGTAGVLLDEDDGRTGRPDL